MLRTVESNIKNLPEGDTMEEAYQDAAVKAWEAQRPRATYGRDVLAGDQNVSGSDLKGAACKRWGASYQRVRKEAVQHAREYGAHVRNNWRTGKLTLEWSPIPPYAREDRCSVGKCWKY